ncbi:formate dehydrogenase accessory sulfurtransferase FdhD [Methanoculleus sp. FWC-SCC1]|uniref:Formate dehydrogenase accessory sulfurtransferase FdhD n=1 Tax=Methanoculleus frigidifontis TaxID=2584085 RepID=A0ABT8M6U4_9EURY|nr:formate dehydrogenase accessory sulfurtransferase FdhD [Methanoculleus sp. FWC-SCC1]MDN7023648.1 formate dehydrogenase accessory sulfurtransferase FdhD [Methanoculleus sp. FWC-SCC1]
MAAEKIPCIRIDGASREESGDEAVEEMPVAFFVNGRHAATVLTSPHYLEEFATGYLYTEQIIRSPGEIESIRVEKNRISVLTKDPFRITGRKKTVLSGCGGAVSYIDTEKLEKIRSDFTVTPAALTAAASGPAAGGDLETVSLAGTEGVIASFEDIDRHTALDRVIGYGLRAGIDFSATFAVTTGTVTSEMVRKCLVAGIPILASTGGASGLAIEIAEATGLCLIGRISETGLVVYTHDERVAEP